MQVKLDVFGRLMLATRSGSQWELFDLGSDGKHRLASDVVIPDFVTEAELAQYLADIFHESASPTHPEVKVLGA